MAPEPARRRSQRATNFSEPLKTGRAAPVGSGDSLSRLLIRASSFASALLAAKQEPRRNALAITSQDRIALRKTDRSCRSESNEWKWLRRQSTKPSESGTIH